MTDNFKFTAIPTAWHPLPTELSAQASGSPDLDGQAQTGRLSNTEADIPASEEYQTLMAGCLE